MKPVLFVAMDNLLTQEVGAASFLEQLAQHPAKDMLGIKANLDYLLIKGLETTVPWLQHFGLKVFADLKMFNGSRTMDAVVDYLVDHEVDYLNIHATAESQLASAVRNVKKMANGSKTKVLAVTILTHMTDHYCREYFCRSLEESVKFLAEAAVKAGADGVILPPTALAEVRHLQIEKCTPGLRPAGYKDRRHYDDVEPWVAARDGANLFVCGSPILKSATPMQALDQTIFEIIEQNPWSENSAT